VVRDLVLGSMVHGSMMHGSMMHGSMMHGLGLQAVPPIVNQTGSSAFFQKVQPRRSIAPVFPGELEMQGFMVSVVRPISVIRIAFCERPVHHWHVNQHTSTGVAAPSFHFYSEGFICNISFKVLVPASVSSYFRGLHYCATSLQTLNVCYVTCRQINVTPKCKKCFDLDRTLCSGEKTRHPANGGLVEAF